MKIWYFVHNNFDCVVAFGDTPQDAWERFIKSRNSSLSSVDTDMSHWFYEEFTPQTCGGVLFFY